jgi:competence protein ComEA
VSTTARSQARGAEEARRDGHAAGASVSRARLRAWAPVLLKMLAMAAALSLLAVVGATLGASSLSSPAWAGASPATDAAATRSQVAAQPADAISFVPHDAGAPHTVPCVAPRGGASRVRATPDDPVYLNDATAEDLRRLPGVGPKRADAILQARARRGRFSRIEELMRVRGVGRATLRKWKPVIRLDRPPPASLPDAGGS